jgi:hypothetical protein
MENSNYYTELQKAMAPRLPVRPDAVVHTARRHKRRPRWLGGRPL